MARRPTSTDVCRKVRLLFAFAAALKKAPLAAAPGPWMACATSRLTDAELSRKPAPLVPETSEPEPAADSAALGDPFCRPPACICGKHAVRSRGEHQQRYGHWQAWAVWPVHHGGMPWCAFTAHARRHACFGRTSCGTAGKAQKQSVGKRRPALAALCSTRPPCRHVPLE